LHSEGQLDKWRKQFISNLCAELPTGEHENWEKCQALFSHARAALAQRPEDRESLQKWALLLYKAAWYAWQQGRTSEAEQMSVVSMEVRSGVLGEYNAETLSTMGMVGVARMLGGKYEEAEAMHRQTLTRSEKVLGPEHPDTLASMSNLAGVLNSQGKYEEAEAMHRQALAICENALGHEHPSTLTSMNNLALVLDSQGKYEEAEAMHRQTLAQRENVHGQKHPDTLTSVHCLAYLLTHRRRYTEALALYVRACTGYQVVLGMDHPTTRACQQHYAKALESEQQSQPSLPATRKDASVVMRTGKESKLLRGLAKISIGSSK
jgi:tetratricopeptide (TPR) repeat protein